MVDINTFIQDIMEAYENARHAYDDKSNHVIRGRSHSISSQAEDLLAGFLYEALISLKPKFEDKLYIYVDIPVSIRLNDGKKKSIYPDIAVCVDYSGTKKCKYLCDLKMDPGWIRDKLESLSEKHIFELKALKTTPQPISIRHGTTKDEIEIDFSECNAYDIVFITSKNGSKKFEDSFKMRKEAREYSSSHSYVLLEGSHPNTYDKNNKNYEEPTAAPDCENWFNQVVQSVDN